MKHYSEVYRQVNGPKPCAACGAQPRSGRVFTRHSPNPQIMNDYYARNVDHDESEATEPRVIEAQDLICYDCYVLHTEIVKLTRTEQPSLNSDLEAKVEAWTETIEHGSVSRVETATLTAATHVAKLLLASRATLLPRVSTVFLEAYQTTPTGENFPEIETAECLIKFSSRWLLQKLLTHLKHHLSYKCIHRKFGTVLYRTGGDLLTSISWALGEKPIETESYCTTNSQNSESRLDEAAHMLNDLVHKEVERLKTQTYDPSKLDIAQYMSCMDPRLLSFFETATQSVRTRCGANSKSESSTTKNLRRQYLVCQIIFCTNPCCPTPLHYLLADEIEVCGGSQQLIGIFNRLGCVVSSDTHDRFVAEKALEHKQESVYGNTSTPRTSLCSPSTTLTSYSHMLWYALETRAGVTMAQP